MICLKCAPHSNNSELLNKKKKKFFFKLALPQKAFKSVMPNLQGLGPSGDAIVV